MQLPAYREALLPRRPPYREDGLEPATLPMAPAAWITLNAATQVWSRLNIEVLGKILRHLKEPSFFGGRYD